jgi:hypothetical protein
LLRARERVRGRNPVKAAPGAIQQCAEDARPVEPIRAVPVDRAVAPDHGGGVQVADDPVLGDRQVCLWRARPARGRQLFIYAVIAARCHRYTVSSPLVVNPTVA